MTAEIRKDGAPVLQGIHKLDLDVQELKGRVNRLEGRMERLENRMERLESSNGRILEQVNRLMQVLTEPSPPKSHDGLSAYLDKIERRITALKR